LRQLASYGFVTDQPDRGRGRERWWVAAHRTTWFDDDKLSGEDRLVGAEYLRAVAGRYANRILRFADALPDALGSDDGTPARPWDMSDWMLQLTAEEARSLHEEVHELLLRYRREDGVPAADGSERIIVQFQMLPPADKQ
jgi:hypothetical protein